MLTQQEIFDRVARHLRTQGGKSTTPKGDGCLYRGPEGRMCGLGIFITDYSPDMEMRGPDTLLEVCPGQTELDGQEIPFLERLQEAHDDALTNAAGEFEQPWHTEGFYGEMAGIAWRLAQVARRCSLNGAVIEELWPQD